jgi:Ras GTPase-activating-like protein IQGAP2/3
MADRRSGMVQSFGYPQNSSIVSRAVAAAAANNHHSSRNRGRGSKRYSVSVFYSMAAEQDVEVEDELAKGKTCKFLPFIILISVTLQLKNVYVN